MITYGLWKDFIDNFTIFTSNSAKIGTYAVCSFLSIITIPVDIITLPFQLIGIIIFLITNRKVK